MVDDSSPAPPAPDPEPGPQPGSPPGSADGPRCPWCSAVLPAAEAAVCPSCGAHLIEEQEVEIPGVTSVYPNLLATAASPRKIKRTFGALFVGEDNDIALPSEAELPALAPPDLEVRREMLRLELDARLAALQAEVAAIESESGPGSAPAGEPDQAAPPDEPAESDEPPQARVDAPADAPAEEPAEEPPSDR